MRRIYWKSYCSRASKCCSLVLKIFLIRRVPFSRNHIRSPIEIMSASSNPSTATREREREGERERKGRFLSFSLSLSSSSVILGNLINQHRFDPFSFSRSFYFRYSNWMLKKIFSPKDMLDIDHLPVKAAHSTI